MPIYEYNCEDCQAEFEWLMRGDEQPACPACGGQRLAKQFSVPAAHSAGAKRLSVCEPPSVSGCGLPQCGIGRCGQDE